MMSKSESQQKLKDTYDAIKNGQGNMAMQEKSTTLVDKLNEELYRLEHNQKGSLITPTPKAKERIAEIYQQMELIKTANTGLEGPRSWGQFFRDQRDLLRSASSPRNIAGNVVAFVACAGAAYAGKIAACVIFGSNPIGAGILIAAAALFVAFKIFSAIRRAYNDSPGARMDAAAQKAGLNDARPNMSPAGATPSVAVYNIQGKQTTARSNEPAPSSPRYNCS